ncbi:LysR family transcriptional regulator [Luteimicrobium subarcticum]|uniref:Molybdate transport repressor ModE-like protein n=1 Tax=Luteimicrobium subarcticum TaxID=620910 RepID=A0A2M8W1V4_9MICO|nr:LysR family transcriptional regulator [Luteimicrobium subarcticum]PJI84907.1 molybdate transport repressor ModE-like protein [Luteimicrobium subarcticum]
METSPAPNPTANQAPAAPTLDPRRLLILRTVAQEGSISAGARALGWTQPAVSQHLQALERSARTPLVLRHAGGVTLTEAGRAAVAHADAVAAHLDAAAREISELAALAGGTVRLAAFPSALAALVPSVLARLAARTGVDVRLVEAEPPEAVELVRSGDVDVALTFGYADPDETDRASGRPATPSADLPPDLREVALGLDPVDVVLPAGHPAADAPALTLADLAEDDWVAGCVRCREHLVASAAAAGFAPRIRHETDDYVVVQAIVAQGLAVSVLPRTALGAYRHPGVVTRAVPGLDGRSLHALHRPGAERVPAVAALLAALPPGTASDG